MSPQVSSVAVRLRVQLHEVRRERSPWITGEVAFAYEGRGAHTRGGSYESHAETCEAPGG